MINPIKKSIDNRLSRLISVLIGKYRINSISPVLSASIKNFILRPGKRIRPVLFILCFKGYSSEIPPELYTTAASLELMHCFLLIHDDIIDSAGLRRGKPAMHVLLNRHKKKANPGIPLALVAGDIIYALAIEAFMSVKTLPERKQKALLKFIESGFYTGCGEFIETINSKEDISGISEKEIYRTYDLKTANYSFSAPLVTSAVLAGAGDNDINGLFKFGIHCGRAFQIKDDIIGIFSAEKFSGKPMFTDILDNKKTLLLWHVFKSAKTADKAKIKALFHKQKITGTEMRTIRKILIDNGSLDYCKNQMRSQWKKAVKKLDNCTIDHKYKQQIIAYCRDNLSI